MKLMTELGLTDNCSLLETRVPLKYVENARDKKLDRNQISIKEKS